MACTGRSPPPPRNCSLLLAPYNYNYKWNAPRKSAETENAGRKSPQRSRGYNTIKHTSTVVVEAIFIFTIIVVVAGCESFLYSCCKPPAVGRRQADPLEKRAQDWIHQEPECGISRNHACDVTSAKFFLPVLKPNNNHQIVSYLLSSKIPCGKAYHFKKLLG